MSAHRVPVMGIRPNMRIGKFRFLIGVLCGIASVAAILVGRTHSLSIAFGFIYGAALLFGKPVRLPAAWVLLLFFFLVLACSLAPEWFSYATAGYGGNLIGVGLWERLIYPFIYLVGIWLLIAMDLILKGEIWEWVLTVMYKLGDKLGELTFPEGSD